MCKNPDFIPAFSTLGSTYSVNSELTESIEKYVCTLYGRAKLGKVNETRSSIFWDKYNKEKKIIDLCMLPPCFSNLEWHIKRSNYVTYLFRYADRLQLHLDPPSLHGWDDTSVRWMDEYFPNDIHSVLIAANEEEDEHDDDDDLYVDDMDEDDADVELEEFS